MIEIKNAKSYKGPGVRIDRSTILGNPFSHRDGTAATYRVETRDDAVERYLEWARIGWKTNPAYKSAILLLVDKYKKYGELTLICWCAPKRCHGEVIKYIIEKIVGDDS